jgi:hypothetical protein
MRDDGAGDDRARAAAEELAWREIVDHYGERPDVRTEAEPVAEPESPVDAAEPADPGIVPGIEPAAEPPVADAPFDPFRLELYDEEFTPPPLPPPAQVTPERRLAWVGLVASPVLLIVLQLIDFALPGILTFGLVLAFIGSFGYLVATMEPRDPDDDGARV